MRNGKTAQRSGARLDTSYVCLLLLFLAMVFTAAGSSPLATQTARIGPYRLLLSFYSLPRTGQQLNMTIQSATSGESLRFSQAVLNPAHGTDATPVSIALSPDGDTPDAYDVNVTPPVRGAWLLHLTVSGPAGSFAGDIPMNVLSPPVMPTWLGWLIGLSPVSLLLTFIWMQVRWRNARRDRVRQELLRQEPRPLEPESAHG
jgi:hypothetical protein